MSACVAPSPRCPFLHVVLSQFCGDTRGLKRSAHRLQLRPPTPLCAPARRLVSPLSGQASCIRRFLVKNKRSSAFEAQTWARNRRSLTLSAFTSTSVGSRITRRAFHTTAILQVALRRQELVSESGVERYWAWLLELPRLYVLCAARASIAGHLNFY